MLTQKELLAAGIYVKINDAIKEAEEGLALCRNKRTGECYTPQTKQIEANLLILRAILGLIKLDYCVLNKNLIEKGSE